MGVDRLPAAMRERYQRARAIAAVAKLVHETGIEPKGVEILAAAQMSSATLYRLFGSKRGAVEAACLEATRGLVGPVRAAGELEEPWLDRLAAAIGALLGAIGEERALAELCLVHSPGLVGAGVPAGPGPVLEALAAVIEGGRQAGIDLDGRTVPTPPAGAERFGAAGVVYILARRLHPGRHAEATEARAELVELAATPFVGEAEAARFAAELRGR